MLAERVHVIWLIRSRCHYSPYQNSTLIGSPVGFSNVWAILTFRHRLRSVNTVKHWSKRWPRQCLWFRSEPSSQVFACSSERTSRANFKDHVNTFSTACRGIDYGGSTANKNRSWSNGEQTKDNTHHRYFIDIVPLIRCLSFPFHSTDKTVSQVYNSCYLSKGRWTLLRLLFSLSCAFQVTHMECSRLNSFLRFSFFFLTKPTYMYFKIMCILFCPLHDDDQRDLGCELVLYSLIRRKISNGALFILGGSIDHSENYRWILTSFYSIRHTFVRMIMIKSDLRKH